MVLGGSLEAILVTGLESIVDALSDGPQGAGSSRFMTRPTQGRCFAKLGRTNNSKRSDAPSFDQNSTLDGGVTLSSAPLNAPAPGGLDPIPASLQARVSTGRSLAWVVVWLIAAGLLVNVHLALLARVLSEAEYGRFVSFVSIVLLISFGGFLPVEQEMARQFQSGHTGREVFRSNAVVAAGIAALSAVLIGGLVPWLMPALADPQIVGALLFLCLVCVVQFLVRGTLIGTGRIAIHGGILFGDSVLRLGFAAVVVVSTSAGAAAGGYALALVAAIGVAHLPILVWTYRLANRVAGQPEVPANSALQTGRTVGHLIAGSISSQILLNAPPILVVAVASVGEADLVGRFAATFTLARLFLFIAVPMQSALVPLFTRPLSDGGDRHRQRLAVRIGLGAFAAAVLAAGMAWIAGPRVIEIVFGPRYALGGRDVALMVGGAMLYLGLIVAAQALVGAGRHRDVGLVWTLGLLGGAVAFLAVSDLVLRAELAFAVGSAVGLILAVGRLWRTARRHGASSPSEAGEIFP